MEPIEIIENVMKQKKLKNNELAEYLGINKSVITNWKARRTNPPLKYAAKICKFLDITIYQLLEEEPKSEIERIYYKLKNEDKKIVDIIFNKYRDNIERQG